MPPDPEKNATFTELRAERVTKDDGRYLIYYSWPGEHDEGEATDTTRAPHPATEPWSPEAGPADV